MASQSSSSQQASKPKRPAEDNLMESALIEDFLINDGFDIDSPSTIEPRRQSKKQKTTLPASPTNANSGNPLPELVIYTDGASSKNGSVKARAGFGVYWGDDHPNNVSERLFGKQTNQRAEASAVIRALEQTLDDPRQLEIRTDSQYVIKAVYEWSRGWKRNGWKSSTGNPVQNRDLFENMLSLIDRRGHHNTSIVYVPGHKGVYGNEMADRLACLGATLPPAGQ
ncbi:Ribonuclease H1 [Apophysomyces sp. BC1034]|nr:Ribonuclease H1 [Apophysomyces sp. BC1034]